MIVSSKSREVVVAFDDQLQEMLPVVRGDLKQKRQRAALGCITNSSSMIITEKSSKQVAILSELVPNDENELPSEFSRCYGITAATDAKKLRPFERILEPNHQLKESVKLQTVKKNAQNHSGLRPSHQISVSLAHLTDKNDDNVKSEDCEHRVKSAAKCKQIDVGQNARNTDCKLAAESSDDDPLVKAHIQDVIKANTVAVVVVSSSHIEGHHSETPFTSTAEPAAATVHILDEDELEKLHQARLESVFANAEYAQDTYNYLRKSELLNQPKPHYMRKQAEVTHNMRTILVDWLVDVAAEYKLHRETLFLSINYLDRFLSAMMVLKAKLQLVGATALFLAAKLEEMTAPRVDEFIYVTADAYTKQQMLRMEQLMLRVLSFKMSVPTANCFCEFMLKQVAADSRTYSLAMYLIELMLLDGNTYLKYLPSVMAASAVCLANLTLGASTPWCATLISTTGYHPADFEHCLRELHHTLQRAPSLAQHALHRKYSHSKYHGVSSLSAPTSVSSVCC